MHKYLLNLLFLFSVMASQLASGEIVKSRSSVIDVSADDSEKIMKFSYFLSPPEKVKSVEVNADGSALLAPKVNAFGEKGETVAVLFLVDVTRSNTNRKLEIQASKDIILALLEKSDNKVHKVGVYPFGIQLDKKFAPFGTELKEVKKSVSKLKTGVPATAFFKCVREAQEVLAAQTADRKVLVILSDCISSDDGDDAPTTAETIKKSIEGGFICDTVLLVASDKTNPLGSTMAQKCDGEFIQVIDAASASLKKNKDLQAYTNKFWSRVTSGGSVLVGLKGREDVKELHFKVNVESSEEPSFYDYVHKLNADPADATDPAIPGDATDPVEPDAVIDREANGDGGTETAAKEEDKKMWLWIILVASAIALVLLIWLIVSKSKSKEKLLEEEEFAYDDGMNQDSFQDADTVIYKGEEEVKVSRYPETFDMGNGKAFCHTLPTSEEEVSAVLLFGERGAKGIYPISTTAVRLGRGQDNDLSFDNDSASRHHAEILSKRTGEYLITDLDSGNGVYVNGEKITQSELRNNDAIEIGEISFVFQLR